MDIDYEVISGEDKNSKIIELIKLFEREGRLGLFIDTCQSLRPNVSFGEQTKSPANPVVEEISERLRAKSVELNGVMFNLAKIVVRCSTVIASGATLDDFCTRIFEDPHNDPHKTAWKLKANSLWYQIIDVVGELVIMGLLEVKPAQPNGYSTEVYFFTDDGRRVAQHLRN